MADSFSGGWAYQAPSLITPELVKGIYLKKQDEQLQQYRNQQNQFRQDRLDDLERQRELDRQAKAASFVNKNFDKKLFATGTDADPLINDMTSSSVAKFGKMVHDNPNMDEGELEMRMQGDLDRISQYSADVKNGRAAIEEGAKHYRDLLPGIDADSLTKGALHRMIYHKDANGRDVLNDKVDPSQDYLHDELKEHPDLYVQGDKPLEAAIKNYAPKQPSKYSYKGTSGTTYTADYNQYPWHGQVTNRNGEVTGLKINTDTGFLNGTPVPIVDEDTYQKLVAGNAGAAANLKRDTDDFIKQSGVNIPEGSSDYKTLGKHILLQKLQTMTPTTSVGGGAKVDTFEEKLAHGLINIAGKGESKVEQRRDEELAGTKYGTLIKAMNGDQSVISAGLPTTVSGKNYVDITDAIGGFNTSADTKERKPTDQEIMSGKAKLGDVIPAYNKVSSVLVDPDQPGKLFTIEDGKLHQYNQQEVNAIMRRHAFANGYKSQSEVDRINKVVPYTVTPKPVDERAEKAKAEYERRKKELANNQGNPLTQPFGVPQQ